MRVSQFLLATVKETPADAEIPSHRLMLRAGMIRRLASGLYNWMPLGLRVLRKVEAIVREEMNRAGAMEVLMPVVQPAELWQESGRWAFYGAELLRLQDRHAREFCLGPTHEEIITDLVRREVRSYKQLPLNLYQVQTKFRDEIRPRYGVMRAREFIMKDAYSFHLDNASLQQTYDVMYKTYSRIFDRIGLQYRAVRAATGAIGGQHSHEFHVLDEAGEDLIALSDEGHYAANVELAEAPVQGSRAKPTQERRQVETPDQRSIEEIAKFLSTPAQQCLKTLLVKGTHSEAVALVIRGDHTLNETKACQLDAVAEPLDMLSEGDISGLLGCQPGFIGPIGLDIPVIADHSALQVSDFVCGANENGMHITGVNWIRDLPEAQAADIRNITAGETSPDGKGQIRIVNGIEVGHIFQLGTKYSEAMNATCLDEKGNAVIMPMGCYGIGISRVAAAAIEQHHDDNGIIWPPAIAPFQAVLLPMNMGKSVRLREAAEQLYTDMRDAGIDVLFDDRNTRPGVMFADMDLIGIPHRIVLGERGLDKGVVEFKSRRETEAREMTPQQAIELILQAT